MNVEVIDDGVLVPTRRSLHGVAEQLIAGPQHRAHGTIRLRVAPGGFAGRVLDVAVDGGVLVCPTGRVALVGTLRDVASTAGIDLGAPTGLYHDTSGVDPDEPLSVDPGAAAALAAWFAIGDEALRAAFPGHEPVLWPEHFDLGVAVGEVNYGVSPGDRHHPRPYAYVAPWSAPPGEFTLGPAADLPDAAAVAAFLAAGRA